MSDIVNGGNLTGAEVVAISRNGVAFDTTAQEIANLAPLHPLVGNPDQTIVGADAIEGSGANSGSVNVRGGFVPDGTADAGGVVIEGGNNAGTGAAGGILLQAGIASGGGIAGNVDIIAGIATEGGTPGQVTLQGVPTSTDPTVPSALWVDDDGFVRRSAP